MRVLIAEDDKHVRQLLEMAVGHELGHECQSAVDGAAAWELVRQRRPDVLITDWLMPELDGAELCRRIREDAGAPYTYIVVLTATSGERRLLEAMQAGADDFLAKPLDLAALEARLVAAERVIALHRRREASLRVAQRFAAETDNGRLFGTLLEEAMSALDATAAAVFMWHEAAGTLQAVAAELPVPVQLAPIRAGQGIIGHVAATRAPVVDNDYPSAYTDEPGAGAFAQVTGIRAIVAVPLLHEGRLLGAIAVGTGRAGRQFGNDDVATLAVLAGICAAAIVGLDRSRLEGALLAARTAQHELNNQLTLTVGFTDLLANDPRLPGDLRELAEEAVRGAEEASATLNRLQRITRLEQVDQGGPGPVLDLDRSS